MEYKKVIKISVLICIYSIQCSLDWSNIRYGENLIQHGWER